MSAAIAAVFNIMFRILIGFCFLFLPACQPAALEKKILFFWGGKKVPDREIKGRNITAGFKLAGGKGGTALSLFREGLGNREHSRDT